MDTEKRVVIFDYNLDVEAYHFKGIMQKFPNHFHNYYVIGIVESGKRLLNCKNKEYLIDKHDIVLLNPYENHECSQIDGKTLDWRCININKNVMQTIINNSFCTNDLPYFNKTVTKNSEIALNLKRLQHLILEKSESSEKEELLYHLINTLIDNYTTPQNEENNPSHVEINEVCSYLQKNYADTIVLDDLSHIFSINKYHLIRLFTKTMGITPY